MSKNLRQVDDRQQPWRFAEMMNVVGLQHGQTAEVNVDSLFVTTPRGKELAFSEKATQEIRFCQIDELDVVEKDAKGDEVPVPRQMKIDPRIEQAVAKLELPEDTFFSLEGVKVFSNGFIELTTTERSAIKVNDCYIPIG